MKSVIIAAGGTGGHIYPALAVADKIRQKHPEVQIFFVGTSTGMENKIIPSSGYPLLHLPIGRLHKSVSLTERIKTVVQLPLALFKAAWICWKLKPEFLLGVGGHASGPMLLAGSLLRYRTVIWEPNAHPGLANRILSRFVSQCFVVFDRAKKFLNNSRCETVGFPIRQQIEQLGVVSKSPHSDFNVLIYGGSQGSLGISQAMLAFLKNYRSQYPNIKLLLQTGATHFQSIKDEARKLDLADSHQLQIVDYIHDMENKYQWCDLVICRSGTGTISELAATGLPSLLVPLPFAADGHQKINAEELVAKNAAFMLLQSDFSPEKIHEILQKFIQNPSIRIQMSKAVQLFYVPHAADDIVNRLWKGG